MRILHTDFHRGWGGQAARVLMLSIELRKRGHSVKIAAPPGELTLRARAAGVPFDDGFVFKPPVRALSFAADVRRLSRLIDEDGIEILHTHGSQDTWVGAATRTFTGKPAIFMTTRHNTKRVRYSVANRFLYGRALDHLLLVSDSIRANYKPYLQAELIKDDQISVVHSSYRTAMFHSTPDRMKVREELGIAAGTPVLGVLARLVKDKGHTYLFRAMTGIRKKFPEALLLVAGLGPHKEALEAEVRELGLEGSIRFLGFRDDAADMTAALDIAVLPSIGCDASSASIKEAMVMGRPVVATDIGGAREILDDGRTGIVVSPGDSGALAAAILTLLEDPDRAATMGGEAREVVRRKFSPDAMADGVLSVYQKLASARSEVGAAVSAHAAGQGGGRS